LANGTVDVLTNTVTHTMGRDVFEPNSQGSFTFSVPYIYSGLAFGGVPEFVDCADELDSFNGDCRFLQMCVGRGTTHELIMRELVPGTVIVLTDRKEETVEKLNDGTCNVVASEPVSLPESRFRDLGYFGPFKVGKNVFSREPLTLVTRDADPEWSNRVNAIVKIFYLAEAENITKSNAEELGLIFANNAELASTAVAIVSEFGNYAYLYDRHIEPVLPRQGLNTIYRRSQDTGLLYSFPFGDLEAQSPDPLSESTLGTILSRGFLRCGIRPRDPFAVFNQTEGVWSGFDVEFCRAVSEAILAGSTEIDGTTGTIVFVNLADDLELYDSLQNGEVDLVAGARMTLQTDYFEPSTRRGYTCSHPYFYDNNSPDAFGFLTNEGDPIWSDFVYWIVMALVYAEENVIRQETSSEMPVVNLFGERLKQMFRDAVHAVGSYGEMYNRTLAPIIPRSGGNMLNERLSGPQQFPFPFA
jgi:ABC-type amino acid transport substrate-binding protein